MRTLSLCEDSGKGRCHIKKKVKCVFVHGWGMNSQVWQPVIDRLPDQMDVQCIDLPGHGEARQRDFNDLHDLVEALASQVDEPVVWIAWSLGGLAVTELALRYPEKVRAIMLVASSPCFVRRENWLHGMPAVIFEMFAGELEKDFSGTIRRFLSLQVRGSESGRKVLKSLREKVLAQPAPEMPALRAGLEVLKKVDLRDQLKDLSMPVHYILGDKDTLIKMELVQQLTELSDNIQTTVYPGAAHAPFLSHLDIFSEQLIQFIKDNA